MTIRNYKNDTENKIMKNTAFQPPTFSHLISCLRFVHCTLLRIQINILYTYKYVYILLTFS